MGNQRSSRGEGEVGLPDLNSHKRAVETLVAALKAAGGQPRYTEYPRAGHDIWVRAFNEPEIVPWLFAQSR